MIIKRIYFPGNVYNQNNIGFKNILAKYGLLGTRSTLQIYPSKDGRQIIYDTYQTNDSTNNIINKILCIYEGDNKPVTLFYKSTGSGGNFLIDIHSFCTNIGCIIDTKNEEYINNIISKTKDNELLIESRLLLGTIYFDKKEYVKAKELYDQILNGSSESDKAHYQLALVYEKLGDYAKYRSELRKAYMLNPKNEDARHRLYD